MLLNFHFFVFKSNTLSTKPLLWNCLSIEMKLFHRWHIPGHPNFVADTFYCTDSRVIEVNMPNSLSAMCGGCDPRVEKAFVRSTNMTSKTLRAIRYSLQIWVQKDFGVEPELCLGSPMFIPLDNHCYCGYKYIIVTPYKIVLFQFLFSIFLPRTKPLRSWNYTEYVYGEIV